MEGELTDYKLDDISKAETVSETHLEDDQGIGTPVILRTFEYTANPEAFKLHKPTKQELFQYHEKQIEALLWADGLKVVSEVAPKVLISKNKKKYRIFVAAMAQHGHMFSYKDVPKKLADLVKA